MIQGGQQLEVVKRGLHAVNFYNFDRLLRTYLGVESILAWSLIENEHFQPNDFIILVDLNAKTDKQTFGFRVRFLLEYHRGTPSLASEVGVGAHVDRLVKLLNVGQDDVSAAVHYLIEVDSPQWIHRREGRDCESVVDGLVNWLGEDRVSYQPSYLNGELFELYMEVRCDTACSSLDVTIVLEVVGVRKTRNKI